MQSKYAHTPHSSQQSTQQDNFVCGVVAYFLMRDSPSFFSVVDFEIRVQHRVCVQVAWDRLCLFVLTNPQRPRREQGRSRSSLGRGTDASGQGRLHEGGCVRGGGGDTGGCVGPGGRFGS